MSAKAAFQSELVPETPDRQIGLWMVPALLLAGVLLFLISPLRSASYPDAFEDDFYYYFVAARHILAGQGSTFDGIHATNGYHPPVDAHHRGHGLVLSWTDAFSSLQPAHHGLRAVFL